MAYSNDFLAAKQQLAAQSKFAGETLDKEPTLEQMQHQIFEHLTMALGALRELNEGSRADMLEEKTAPNHPYPSGILECARVNAQLAMGLRDQLQRLQERLGHL